MEATYTTRSAGNLHVWRGALEGEFAADELKQSIPFKKHTLYGYTDREIWRQDSAQEARLPILQRIETRVAEVLGLEADVLGAENFANFYADASAHCFSHRDSNLNPGRWVTLVCFGVTRHLAWVDCQTKQYTVTPLTDGTIVRFDWRWNATHYHKILKERTEEELQARVSLQWYDPRDEASWNKNELSLWQKYAPSAKGISTLRSNLKKHLEPRGARAETAVPAELKDKRARKRAKVAPH